VIPTAEPLGIHTRAEIEICLMCTWTWSLDWDEIMPGILVGNCPMTPRDLERIAEQGAVSALLSLQHDDCLAYWGSAYRSREDLKGLPRIPRRRPSLEPREPATFRQQDRQHQYQHHRLVP
jgi:hypothetical protein